MKEWHLWTVLLAIVLAVLKEDISKTIHSILLVYEERKFVGQTVLLLNVSVGTWSEATILKYELDIPLIRKGAVYLTHSDPNTEYIDEKIYFDNWENLRVRLATGII